MVSFVNGSSMNFYLLTSWTFCLLFAASGVLFLDPCHASPEYEHVSQACAAKWKDRNNSMCYITYNKEALHGIGKQLVDPRLPLPVLHNIRSLGICCRKQTHRGSKAGTNTRYKIQVIPPNRQQRTYKAGGIIHNNLIIVPVIRWNLPIVMNTNITGALSNKIPEIKKVCDDFNTDIICITETWCTSLVPDETINISGYTQYRRDRKDGRSHGGIICYIKNHIPVVHEWSELDIKDLETLWITIRPQRMPREYTHITVGIVYHPPKADDWAMSKHITTCVDKILQKYTKSGLLILGDFNHMRDTFMKRTCALTQTVKKPTHMKSTIDLCYTNMRDYYGTPKHEPGIGLSKHQVIICVPCTSGVEHPKTEYVSRRCQGNKERAALCRVIQAVNWEPLYQMQSCQEQFTVFETVMNNLIDEYLPVKKMKHNSNDHPWITDEFHSLVGLRQFYFHTGNKTMFSRYRNKVNRERKLLQKKYYDRKMKNLKSERPSEWWHDIKEITGTKCTKNDLQGLANTVCNGNIPDLASKINGAFQAVSNDMTALTAEDCFTIGHNNQEPIPDRYIISVSQVEKSLQRINPRKAVGPDSIPNWLLKSMSITLAPPVCAIWNSSIREAYLPSMWKSGDVCPVPKKKRPMNIEKDLRPITLSPQLSKSLEWYPREWLLEFLVDIIDPHQYGSLRGSSTVMALVELVHNWLAALENFGTVVRILLLDFRKAFDRVDHHILLSKLRDCHIPNFLIQWMTAFLCERKQRVKINNIKSDWSHLKAGVPQGTLLGPVSFLVHINDLKTTCNTVKYVDDTTIWEACHHTGADSIIQKASDQAAKWTDKNNMQLNTDKTKEMNISFGKKTPTFEPININGNKIGYVENFKLLGVIINNKLNWHDHTDYICGKASQRIYFLILLKRAGKQASDIVQVYVSKIRSVLEYACEVWHPGLTQEQSNMIEHVQKRALNVAFPDMGYEEAMAECGLCSLKQRRELQCKNFFQNMTEDSHKLNHLLPPKRKAQIQNLRSARKYETPRIRTDRLKNSPVNYGLFNFQ